jgi:hypothetical protein
VSRAGDCIDEGPSEQRSSLGQQFQGGDHKFVAAIVEAGQPVGDQFHVDHPAHFGHPTTLELYNTKVLGVFGIV